MRELAGVVVLAVLAGPSGPDEAQYRQEVEGWRRQREARLAAEGGWLSLAGLFWLKEGQNTFGSEASNTIVLPPGSVPGRAGVLVLSQGRTTVRMAPGVTATIGGRAVVEQELRSDATSTPDVLTVGRLTLHLIERGGRLALRAKDPQHPARLSFKGLRWYPVDAAWRVQARFVPYDTPRIIEVPNVLGTVEPMRSPGYVVFRQGAQEVRLDPVLETPQAQELFFIFRDRTSGKDTYGGGRFLYTTLPREGVVVLDFNKAYSPPCAFTRYATCPLPPRQNRLALRVEAGEKHRGKGH